MFRLPSCRCGRMTSAGIPTPRERDKFGERTAGGLCGEGFRKGKMEGTGTGRREIKKASGEQRRVRAERKRQSEKSRQPRREERREGPEVAKQGRRITESQNGRGWKGPL